MQLLRVWKLIIEAGFLLLHAIKPQFFPILHFALLLEHDKKKKKNRASFCYLIFFKKLLSTWQKHAKTIMVKETTTMKPNGSNDKGIGALFSVEKLCQHLKDLQCSYYRFRKGY